MPDIYLKRLHGAEYTKLKEPVPAETTGRLPDVAQGMCSPKFREPVFAEARGESLPPRAAPACRRWKRSNRLFERTGLRGAAFIHGAFVQGRCRSTAADAAHGACARVADRSRSRGTPPRRARRARVDCPHRS